MGTFLISEGIFIKGWVKLDVGRKGGPGCVETVFILADPVGGKDSLYKNLNEITKKHMTIVNDNSSVVSKWSFKLIDDPIVIIYNCNAFILQSTTLKSILRLLTNWQSIEQK